MTRQVLDMTLGGEGWTGALRLDPALVAGGQTAYLRLVRNVAGSVQIETAVNATLASAEPGPHFTEELETADEALTFVGPGGSTLVLKGPNHPDNGFVDPDEPYFWTPDNATDAAAWFPANSFQKVTLTLDDGIDATLLGGGASADAAQASARVELRHGRMVRGRAPAGAAEARARVDVLPPLALADFDAEGLELDALALIEAGAGANNTLFGAPPRTVVGALLDGELGIGAGDTQITRIRRRGGNILVVNDDEPLSLDAYFNGAGADLTLYVQTRDGLASVPVSTQSSAGANFIQLGALDAAFVALLDGIAAGDRFIFALARQAAAVVAVQGRAEAGGAEAAARLLRVTPAVRALRGAALAGGAEARARLAVGRVRPVRGAALAGAAEARARLAVGRVRALRGDALAGGAQALARVLRARHLLIRGRGALGQTARNGRCEVGHATDDARRSASRRRARAGAGAHRGHGGAL